MRAFSFIQHLRQPVLFMFLDATSIEAVS